jgi:cytochrome b561
MSDVPAARRFANVHRWGAVSQALHWIVVLLIATMAAIGLTMTDLPNNPDKVRLYALHKSIGLTILALVALRLLWRAYAGRPAPLPMPRWQHAAATFSHVGLYVLLFAIPLSGWAMNSAAGFPLSWFGLVKVPALVSRDHALHELLESTHEALFWTLIVLALVHAFAALYHHIFQRDTTLVRMLPRGWLHAQDALGDTPNDR